MDLSRLVKRDTAASAEPAFPVPHLIGLLHQHGFDYLGFSGEPGVMRGVENHSFSNGEVTFLFAFAYGMYGEDFIAIGDTAKPETLVYLSYYVDYAIPRNEYRDDGLSHDEALAMALHEHVEHVVALYRYVRSQDRSIPLKADRADVLGASPNNSFKPKPLRDSA